MIAQTGGPAGRATYNVTGDVVVAVDNTAPPGRYAFTVTVEGDKIINLRAESLDDRDQWIERVQFAVKGVREKASWLGQTSTPVRLPWEAAKVIKRRQSTMTSSTARM